MPTLQTKLNSISNGSQRAPASPFLEGPINETDSIPLSFGQQRLWFLDQMEPDSPLYNIPYLVRLKGRLDVATLKRSLEAIVERHESLRTMFVSAGEQPVQVVRSPSAFELPTEDLSKLPEDRREAELRRLARKEATQPFSLQRDLKLRARLFRLGETDHALMLVMHHIAADGWSTAILYRELGALYESFSKGEASPLPELPIQYADFAMWQQEYLRGKTLDRLLNYWKTKLAGAPALLELPADRPRPPAQSYRGDVLTVQFPSALGKALKEFSQQQHTTFFMTLLAAFKVLLHRYTGQTDLVVGSLVAGRDRQETENLIGFFVNTLVLRTDLSGDPTFKELLARARDVALAAYDHQEIPFEKLVEELQPERNLSYGPLCQTAFALQNMPTEVLKLTGLTLSVEPVYTGTAKFDLMVWAEEAPEGLSVSAEYNTDLFLPETIRRLLGHFQTLLEAIVKDADQRISQLPLLTDSERTSILVQWNETGCEFAKAKCIHQLFEEQAERTPNAVAVVFEDQQLTYRELDERANALAIELQALAVGPDVRVGICMDRSIEMMVGLLGILKAGGCYVPLDPTYPPERLAFMLEDSQAPVLLTETARQDHFRSSNAKLKILCLDTLKPKKAKAHDRNSHVARNGQKPKATDLAYVIYTSGSTGKPKGVMLTHRNVVNFFTGMDRVLGTEPGVWLAVTSISFDISVLELFWTLARGFKVVIHPDEQRAPQAATRAKGEPTIGERRSVPEQIAHHGVSHLQCTPSLARTLVLTPESLQALRSLRNLLLGGEALPVSLAKQLRPVVPCLLNMYGPTETTIWSACHRVGEVEDSVPIGRPIANTQIYILDKNLQPVPVGVPGEILIGGDGLARGYLNRPELTAEKFIRNPLSTDTNARLYRTGDLGRWLADGTIEFLGRLDFQVKLRGHRIELGEIDCVLGKRSGVIQSVTVVREDTPGDARLVSYVVPDADSIPGEAELREFLKQRLPDYMVPSAFVLLEQLPLTPNGKVDRKALPVPDQPRREANEYVAPRTPTEQALTVIWSEVLRVKQVGIHDNFFELGGHSLLAAQAMTRTCTALEVDLSVRALFESPTVAGLAQLVTKHQGRRDQNAIAPITRRSHRRPPVDLLSKLDQLSDDELESLIAEAKSQRPASR